MPSHHRQKAEVVRVGSFVYIYVGCNSMRRTLILNIIFAISLSCNEGLTEECLVIQEWKVQNYKIKKMQCPDLVLAHYYKYDLNIDGKTSSSTAFRVDSCVFTCQATNESFLTLNVCNNSFEELKSTKSPLDSKSIDSITMFSRESMHTQLWTKKEIKKFVEDWNNCRPRGFSDIPFDSAFFVYPAYQYRITVFSKGSKRLFYGYNYLILDSDNWEYEMSPREDLKYFHSYWKK